MERAIEPSSEPNGFEASAQATGELVDIHLVRTWLYWALAWLTIFPLVGHAKAQYSQGKNRKPSSFTIPNSSAPNPGSPSVDCAQCTSTA